MDRRLVALAAFVTAVVPGVALGGGAAMSPELHAALVGKNEVPAKGPASGKGGANVTLKRTQGQVCWHFKISGIGTAQAAHIHKGRLGVAGPVVVPLGGAYKAQGCTKSAKALIGAIQEHPNDYYVNVHTAKYPAGAIRGQLVSGMMKL